MRRFSENRNLRLYSADTFQGLPIMGEKGPFILGYLEALSRTINLALDQYPRVIAFRVDLRLPRFGGIPDDALSNRVISRFIESFKAKIEHDREKAREQHKYAHACRVRYVWAREVGWGGRPHYHLLILLNRDAYYTVGRLQSQRPNMISRMQEAWASALKCEVEQVQGLVEIPKNAEYRVDRNVRPGNVDQLPELFHRASYLCKAATKRYGDGAHGFGCSRG
ncbi:MULTISPECIES: inovirus Gp2 family protein [unclassified Pseudomonas]|uniref:inovirus Gp2 family protein n=1 Tax=unclassified Pseudomonas TaxID=196821 RepID=UPI00209793F7|nr:MULTISPECIES: inovirus Gp2 family protein [unclassified Pseudomonas]MCO7504824.1 inovirus Gp2 family protein [Pseudomonas sp. VE 267-6A]MCO7531215.1 inovirus Gp2 family protein [Pseudomonas sp. 2]